MSGAKHDILFLTGDVQPFDPDESVLLGEAVLSVFSHYGGHSIISLGGLASRSVPKSPRIYCTGTHRGLVNNFCASGVSNSLYGVVGPIVGMSGVLLGLAGKQSIPAVVLLAETGANPMVIGAASAKKLVDVVSKKLGLVVDSRKILASFPAPVQKNIAPEYASYIG